MKKIAILGATGMLGSGVYSALKDKYELILVVRDPDKIQFLENKFGTCIRKKILKFDSNELLQEFQSGLKEKGTSKYIENLINEIGKVDGIINCIGITNRYSQQKPLEAFFINGGLPFLLSSYYGPKLIQITTDCVFNGKIGAPYYENSSISPVDLYGLSKSLGEPNTTSLVLRTSIIGMETHGNVSLIEWFKQQSGKKIKGYLTHFWNGITTKQFGLICEKIFNNRNKYPENGKYHIYSTDLTKYEMLIAFRNKFNIDVEIEPTKPPKVDRRLRTIYDLNEKLKIPSFQEMLDAI